MKTYLSPNDLLQNSAASAFVILKLSPWNKPLGKMAFSSASMWLKISDSLVRFRLSKRGRESERNKLVRDVIRLSSNIYPNSYQWSERLQAFNKYVYVCLSITKQGNKANYSCIYRTYLECFSVAKNFPILQCRDAIQTLKCSALLRYACLKSFIGCKKLHFFLLILI